MSELILGEFRRTLDDRFRVSLPSAWLTAPHSLSTDAAPAASPEPAADANPPWVLAKERPGCLSLWRSAAWQQQMDLGLDVIRSKLRAGRLAGQIPQLQALGRLLSTRHRPVALAGRGRLTLPEGFREFLGAEPGEEVILVGAAVCIEIWLVDAWRTCLAEEIPQFAELMKSLVD